MRGIDHILVQMEKKDSSHITESGYEIIRRFVEELKSAGRLTNPEDTQLVRILEPNDEVKMKDHDPNSTCVLVYSSDFPVIWESTTASHIGKRVARYKIDVMTSTIEGVGTHLLASRWCSIIEHIRLGSHRSPHQLHKDLPIIGADITKNSDRIVKMLDLARSEFDKQELCILNSIVQSSRRDKQTRGRTPDIIESISMISGIDTTSVGRVLRAIRPSISIEMIEILETREGSTQDDSDLLVEIPFLGSAYIDDLRMLITDLGAYSEKSLEEQFSDSADEGLSIAITRSFDQTMHKSVPTRIVRGGKSGR